MGVRNANEAPALSDAEIPFGQREQAKPGQCRLHHFLWTLNQQNVAHSEINVTELTDEPGAPTGNPEQVHAELRVQVKITGVAVCSRTFGAHDHLQR